MVEKTFNAAQAAQKTNRRSDANRGEFNAAQAAQKLRIVRRGIFSPFNAAQAAQKIAKKEARL